MDTTRYIDTPSYGGREHFVVDGFLQSYLAAAIVKTSRTYYIVDLFTDIAWAEVIKTYPALNLLDFAYELRNQHTGYIEIVFYRRR